MKKYGIMGGTFDPIHHGHLVIANEVLSLFDLDKIIFIPTGMPPHKIVEGLTSPYHRYMMTQFATMTNPDFDVSDIETKKSTMSYTIDTLKELISGNEEEKFYFITGTDAVLDLPSWKNTEEILSLCTFIAVNRPGYIVDGLDKKIKAITDKYGGEIYITKAPQLHISSTDIRNRIASKRPVKYLLPEMVEQYILKNGLYQEIQLKCL
ncbi:nicotinate-nucleotide adenylyltransferase [Dethiosulfatibacter aminovorans DSM 17477]|uniref:Probable nicotinate-nucleotide adenylyltransferase n=1 Tax=Dethiosulfatibacter aminovorans DSM 17477 TaxID=1121476 RepID=A0A1M6CY91_9FIRM|nr:nicotinate-nucleotide adenylyltransferase [Dethiosulfatibacter aminovorans]SHI65967.1 nicotinate-nucleotide adenylyltransferase [Dethiosulfatibacter aminovorans DSM 17477]